MSRFLLCISFCVLSFCLLGQYNYHGIIYGTNNISLSDVLILGDGKLLATSNKKGKFQFEFSKNERILVEINLLGYQNKMMWLDVNSKNVILLERENNSLPEIKVTPYSKEQRLLLNVINNIPKNYSNQKEKFQGKIVETLSNDDNQTKLIYRNTALISYQKEPYSNPHKEGLVKIDTGFSEVFESLDSTCIQIYAGTHVVHRFDPIARREHPFKKSKIFDYQLLIADTILIDNENHIQLDFSYKNNFGTIWINAEDYSVIKTKYHVTEKHLIPFVKNGRTYLTYETTYKKTDNNFVFDRIEYESAFFNKRKNDTTYLKNIFTRTKVLSYSKLKYKELSDFDDFLIYELKNKNEETEAQEIIKELNVKIKQSKILSKLSSEMGVAYLSYRGANFINRFQTNFSRLKYHDGHKIMLRSSFDYEWKKKWFVGVNFLADGDDNLLTDFNVKHLFPLGVKKSTFLIVKGGLGLMSIDDDFEVSNSDNFIIDEVNFSKEGYSIGFRENSLHFVVGTQLKKKIAYGLSIKIGIDKYIPIDSWGSLIIKSSIDNNRQVAPISRILESREFVFNQDWNAFLAINFSFF